MKALYISDSLGTPIHARGIFNYSISLIEILQGLGARVDLVVEDAPGFGMRGLQRLSREAAPAVNSLQLSEIHRYFRESHFHIRWPSRVLRRWLWLGRMTLITFYLRTLFKLFQRGRGQFVNNEADLTDFIPQTSEHLRSMNGFVLKRKFYWGNAHRPIYGLGPGAIDATGYDLVVLDTPHFLKVTGIGPDRIFAVIHDLIPLRDPTTASNWRHLFLAKLRATLALRSNIIFVSNYTRDTFHASFPGYVTRKEIIMYPAIRSSLLAEASAAIAAPVSGTVSEAPHDENLNLLASRRLQADKGSKSGKSKKKERRPNDNLDLSLPYFATAISDEPRKNVPLLVKACALLAGRVNFVVVGMVDENRLLKNEMQRPTNIVFTGYLPEATKLAVFRGAAGLVFPSFAEGFGIPLVEGAVMGLPVLCSDIKVFREVAGDMAIYFDPYDPKSLAKAIGRVLDDPVTARRHAESLRTSVIDRFSQRVLSRNLATALTEVGLSPRAQAAF